MKTNTNTLRRALETFAKTGKITLTASALMALALSAPVNAETKEFTDAQYINSDVTIASGDTYDYKGAGVDVVPNDSYTTTSGLVVQNGTLTVKGTANVYNQISLGTAAGQVSSLVIDGGTLKMDPDGKFGSDWSNE